MVKKVKLIMFLQSHFPLLCILKTLGTLTNIYISAFKKYLLRNIVIIITLQSLYWLIVL